MQYLILKYHILTKMIFKLKTHEFAFIKIPEFGAVLDVGFPGFSQVFQGFSRSSQVVPGPFQELPGGSRVLPGISRLFQRPPRCFYVVLVFSPEFPSFSRNFQVFQDFSGFPRFSRFFQGFSKITPINAPVTVPRLEVAS